MNERIKELVEQATTVVEGWSDESGTTRYYEFDKQKFAELIIKECMQQCKNVRDDAKLQKKNGFLTDSGKLLYDGVWGGANNCGFAIQNHFGVEE